MGTEKQKKSVSLVHRKYFMKLLNLTDKYLGSFPLQGFWQHDGFNVVTAPLRYALEDAIFYPTHTLYSDFAIIEQFSRHRDI